MRRATRDAHVGISKIRELMFELGIAVDLHCLRYKHSHELIHLLLGHAGREEQLLYRWADQEQPAHIVDAVTLAVAAH